MIAQNPHVDMTLDGVEIFLNSSASHHELRKSAYVSTSLIKQFTSKCGGIYVYTNQRGCDGDRLYFDGVSTISVNGEIVAKSRQFALEEVEVITAVVDLEDVRNERMQHRSSRDAATKVEPYPRFQVDVALSEVDDLHLAPSSPLQVKYHTVEEEIALGPACWLWDILKRSNLGGFFLPLSGGRDSASTACVVYSMCRLICQSVKDGDDEVINDLRAIVGDSRYVPENPKELCNRLFVTCYLGTENSSQKTKDCAEKLAGEIGSYHVSCKIDIVVNAVLTIFKTACGFVPKFRCHGGETRENLALQNLQARLRMVVSYFFAQLTQWSRSKRSSLLVLGSANVDESLTGYMTKYDCSSADFNPIGGLSKNDLKKFLEYSYVEFELPALRKIIDLEPSAELEPLQNGVVVQSDEADMGMTYDELSVIGKLRKPGNCGPYSIFCKLVHIWSNRYTPLQVAEKVELFFRMYSMNRHKMTVITPSYYAESYSPDDHRYDHRQFLYNVKWPWQFKLIESKVRISYFSLFCIRKLI
uniref:Glutamine-dependent NAD(+) synthetase n=1 Tax=Romanomermis culicivorax TaxID=13658 RepID=A0A915HEJ1_ROMCU